ncbi:delta(3,5)-Delta(2,4)-dienoyl-CoA isomerase, mitochondrial-like isoform X1 [Varroa jacobsoni]|uniref:delta(3,5)-Delta(2,4)-dienoyl-CoA isomerase, mitochondrial-like isoform X1 n=2 Tax=Varroa jacobsoni TaxID=62625 RepID=UPI000BF2A491|nr:delta(3,5)-Delta(2,4)-dienoyl-CoA isomerase, mitochondrial-like isoform X1 [Varroa jacobsoni]
MAILLAVRRASDIILSGASQLSKRAMSATTTEFTTLKVYKPAPFVYNVELNRPEKRNAMNSAMWSDIPKCFALINTDPDCRVVIFSGSGAMFTAGLDLTEQAAVLAGFGAYGDDASRKFVKVRNLIQRYQYTVTSIEKCAKPVIAAIHGGCIGAGNSLIASCDIRYCTEDAWFTIREIDVGLCADVGVLQRLPKIVGNGSLISEWALTGRRIDSKEARQEGLVSKVVKDKDQLMKVSLELANTIAAKSPVAVQGTKVNLVYSRSYPVDQALEFMATWNACHLQSEDVATAATALISKDSEQPVFAKL